MAVESANTVGFDTLTSQAGFNWIAPEFLSVGMNTVDIQSIQLTGQAIDPNGGDQIQFLDDGGATETSYGWILKADSGAAKDGWFDEDAWELAEVTIDAGQGVMISTQNSDVEISIPAAL